MIFLYILLAVIALIALVIAVIYFAPISARIIYDGKLRYCVRILFIRYTQYPKKEKKNRKKHKHKQSTVSEKSETTSDDGIKTSSQKNTNEATNEDDEDFDLSGLDSPKEALQLLIDMLKNLFDAIGDEGKIKIRKLMVTASKPDAADTAVLYGIYGGLVTTALAMASEFSKCRINEKNVGVIPDFATGKSKIDVDITISSRLVVVYGCLFRAYLKNEEKKRRNIERMIRNDKRSEHSGNN